MNDECSLKCLTADLLLARDAAQLTTQPSQRDAGFRIERGYDVGYSLHTQLVERGYRPVGRKIGFTNPATWREFNLNTPVWAPMYEQTVHFAERNNCFLALSGMAAPRIEPEVVLKLRHPIPGGDLSVNQLASCLEWAAVGFEMVDCHYPDWRFTAADAVADFGVHAVLVVGEPWHLESEDPRQVAEVLQTLMVSLCRGSEIVARGEGRNALGSPLLALGHLARLLAVQHWAPPLMPGELITTGTLTSTPFVKTGEHWRVEVTGAPLAALELALRG
jgi:2-keto-4-pentenoate hydratase